jgi:SRSO17 transposase
MAVMAGGTVEATLELWASSLRDVKGRIRPLFQQERVAASAGLFLDALLGPERRKTGWMRAEAAGDPGPWRQQALLGRAQWDADALRDVVRSYAIETLAEPDAVLVVDETGFLKQGRSSCGVGRQYTGSAGKITNCQIDASPRFRLCSAARFRKVGRRVTSISSASVAVPVIRMCSSELAHARAEFPLCLSARFRIGLRGV